MRIHGLIQYILLSALLAVAFAAPLRAADAFVVSDIEMTGLQRISEGTVLNYLPVRVGDTVTAENIRLAVRSLYRAGFFHDIRVRRDNDILVFEFDERPSIARFRISGNKDIETPQLERILREQGLAEGRILDRSTLEAMEAELERVYQGRGKYNIKVSSEVKDLANNLVDVSIRIQEGMVSRIAGINIVGNSVFEEQRLQNEMELRASHFWSWMSSDDKYSRERLVGDLERLRSFYYDRGYADFEAENVQVSLSPDKRDVFITIGVREGEVYTIEKNEIRGELIVSEEELSQFILLKEGETFSMRTAEAGGQFMVRRLEAEGYAFAKVETIPEVNRDDKTVTMRYYVNPGRRAYVRSIVFQGAPGTNDEVYRREMRVFEGAWLNNARVERSKVRIERLPFVERAEVDTRPVPGSPDEVDVVFNIKERNAGEFQIGVGYAGSATGIMGNASVSHTNFLGTGDSLSLSAVSSSFSRSFSVSHRDPYATMDGISRSVSLFYREQSALGRRLEQFDTTSYGAGLDYSYPISEFSSIGWGVSANRNEVQSYIPGASLVLENFLLNPVHGDITITPTSATDPQRFPGQQLDLVTLGYNEFVLNGRYVFDTRNRSIFANRGMRRELSLGVSTPVGDVEYYQARISQRNFFPLGAGFTLTTNMNVGVAAPFGSSEELPPGKRFLAGGFDTIRSFRESYLGPRDENIYDENGELVRRGTGFPVGGRLRTFVQTELLLPNFTADDPSAAPESAQFSIFLDTGYLFPTVDDFDVNEFRVSAGVAATFLTPVGALRFALGHPIVRKDGDEVERVQFTIGSVF